MEIFVVGTAATVAAGLVVAIRGDTMATGVVLDTDVETNGVVTDESTGVPLTPAVLPRVVVGTLGAVDLDICAKVDGIVD